MKRMNNRRLAVLMAFHAMWGLVLWLSISKYGLGISTDSVHLLFGGLNLAEGRGLVSFDGSFLALWPPLYPMLLALIHLVSGLDIFVSANVLQAASFLGLSVCLSVLFLKIFPDNFLLALAANILSDVGVVVLAAFDIAGSDYVHLFFAMLLILLAGYYIESKSARILLAMSVVGTLAMFQRYLGIAAIATGAAVVFFFTDESLLRRIGRSLLMALSALPAGIWLFFTLPLTSRRAPISFADNFSWFSKSVLEWFLPAEAVKASLPVYTAWLWIVITGLILLVIFSPSRYRQFSFFAAPIAIYGMFYLLALFGTASITYFNKLGGRFLLPLYIPFVTLLILASGVLLRFANERKSKPLSRVVSVVVIGGLVVIAGSLLRITIPLAIASRATGAAGENAFNTKEWRENSVMNYWLEHQPQGEYVLFSNYPDAIAFYTWHGSSPSPRKFSGPYGKEEFPVTQYTSELFASGLDVYIIWIEPNAYSFFYPVEELGAIANIKPVFISKDGGIYNLKPVMNFWGW